MHADVAESTTEIDLTDRPRALVVHRSRADRAYRASARTAGATMLLIMGAIGLFLLVQGIPAMRQEGLSFLTEFEWVPKGTPSRFGIAAVLYQTLLIAVVALTLAVPVAIGGALFINEYAPRRLRKPLTSLIDLLAAIPSIIYGLWGFWFLQPYLIGVSRFLTENFGFIPVFKTNTPQYAASNFVAGVVVSLMVLPIACSVMREVFSQAPPGEKEGALALGATRWGMIRTVVLPFGRGGIIGGSMLGFGRALGETVAVALIISPSFDISPRILEQGGNSIAALIFNRFGEDASSPISRSALIAAGFSLFVVTLVVNMIASRVVSRSRSGKGVEI